MASQRRPKPRIRTLVPAHLEKQLEQTQIARFWNDGLGTAFAMGYWNKIAQGVAAGQGLSLVSDARLFLDQETTDLESSR